MEKAKGGLHYFAHYFIATVGILLIMITVVSLLYDFGLWFLKILDFPRIQVTLGLMICLLLYAFLQKRWSVGSFLFLISLITAIVLQAVLIVPYTPLVPEAIVPAKQPVNQAATFSILEANVKMNNRNAAPLLQQIRKKNPVLIITVETDQWWIDQLQPLTQHYPYVLTRPFDNTYGMALYSRLPLIEPQILYLNHEKVPSFHTRIKLPGGDTIILHAIHPVPPKPSKYPDNVGEKEVALQKIANLVQQLPLPAVVAGDFNDVGWSHNTKRFAEKSHLHDVRIGRGFYNTFDVHSLLFRWPLDYIYVSKDFQVTEVERLPAIGSDHFPIYVQLVLP